MSFGSFLCSAAAISSLQSPRKQRSKYLRLARCQTHSEVPTLMHNCGTINELQCCCVPDPFRFHIVDICHLGTAVTRILSSSYVGGSSIIGCPVAEQVQIPIKSHERIPQTTELHSGFGGNLPACFEVLMFCSAHHWDDDQK